MIQQPLQRVNRLNRSISSLSKTNSIHTTHWQISQSPSTLKQTNDAPPPRYLQTTASAQNKVQSNSTRQRKPPESTRGGSKSNSSQSPPRSRSYTCPWADGISSLASNLKTRPFQSHNVIDQQGHKNARQVRWAAAAAAADSRSRSGYRPGKQFAHNHEDYETEIEQLQEALHRESRAKDQLRIELRHALQPDQDLEDECSNCNSCGSSPPTSFYSVSAHERLQESKWSRSQKGNLRSECHRSPGSLPSTPCMQSYGRYSIGPDIGRSWWYNLEEPGGFGGRGLSGPQQQDYKPRVRYYYDDGDEEDSKRLRRKARQRYEDKRYKKVQSRIRWPWLCFTGGQSQQSRHLEIEKLKEYNRILSAQLQRLEGGHTLRQGLKAGLGLKETIDIPKLDTPADKIPRGTDSDAELIIGVPNGEKSDNIMKETTAVPVSLIMSSQS